MKKNFLTVPIYCNKLVKSYLEKNFGDPVTISEVHPLYKFACAQFFKENKRPDIDNGRFIQYQEKIDFNISEWSFKFDGFNVNTANLSAFNNCVMQFIKVLCRTNLDTLLLLQGSQMDWKGKYLRLLQENIVTSRSEADILKAKKELQKELGDHEFTIKKAIEYVVTVILKLDLDILPYETVKKDYYRFRTVRGDMTKINI